MSRVVVDCSMTCCWLLDEESNTSADTLLQQVVIFGAYAPSIWWVETRIVSIASERRRRITPVETNESLSLLVELGIHLDSQPVEGTLLTLARRHGLTVYDALNLELAYRQRVPLAKLDRALARAAGLEEVPLAN